MKPLTKEEKQAVSVQIHANPSPVGDILQYGFWLLPSVGFALYGLYQREPIAVGFAFFILLTMAIWFLTYSHKHSAALSTALQKYENSANALSNEE